jgi:hypothetical protein
MQCERMLRCVFSHIFADFVGNQLASRFGIRFGVGIVFCETAVRWYFGAHLVTNFGSLGLVLRCALRLVRKNWAPDFRSAEGLPNYIRGEADFRTASLNWRRDEK